MAPTSVIAQLVAADKASRQKIIEALDKVSQWSKQNEPEVTRYAICIPRDEADGKPLWVIENYDSQEAFDSHMASKPVVDLITYFGANATLFGGEPTIATSELTASFTRPEAVNVADPFITYASIEYKDGKRVKALEGWKHVASETEKNEPSTLSYEIQKNKDHPETVKTIEVYRNIEYFKEVHIPSKAVQENKAKYGDETRVSLKHAFLKISAGYLVKGKNTSSL
ncbi:hypothetical protein K458DRAFT_473495 [Lentithecium fluviatile CBS 122367]|uniref:ABM domain-containing protein n=1 Tax=Lentithecium fluviatile CBS 122367 TaxID=1168545 RepID=A0A6G1JMS8_9PLEO|nr:hypothetical protein K458DRAFT_473495 [Lentithecium fluviatile CBS 122367]